MPRIERSSRIERAVEIKSALDGIDMKSARPLRAILTDSSTEEDRLLLRNLEQQAVTLRAELAVLESVKCSEEQPA